MSVLAGDFVSVEHRGRIYRAKIVDTRGSQVKVHYVGWKARWDEWMEGCSPRIVVDVLGDGDEMDAAEEAVLRAELFAGGGVVTERSVSDLERSLELVIDSVQSSLVVVESGEIPPSQSAGAGNKRKRGLDDQACNMSRSKRASVQYDQSVEVSPGIALVGGLGGLANSDGAPLFNFPPLSPVQVRNGSSVRAEHRDGSSPPLSVPVSTRSDISPYSAVVQSVPMCALCSSEIGESAIRCGGCSRQFHPDLLCLGVSESIIRALLEATDGSITYKCCRCRVNIGDGGVPSIGEAMNQVLSIIGGLVAHVRSTSNDLVVMRKSISRGGGSVSSSFLTNFCNW